MILYMIRHGESEANRKGIHAGWAQVPLTEKGKAQAEMAGNRLKGIAFDLVITSDLCRAVETCSLALPGCSFEQSSTIREINVGTLSGKSADECKLIYGEDYLTNKQRQDYTPYGGENREMLAARVADFLQSMEIRYDGTIAVFTHEGVLRTALEQILSAPRLSKRLLCDNCCISVFEYTNGIWRLNAWNI